MRNQQRGITCHGRCSFTLIELLVVVAIIGVLSALLLPAISGVRDNANMTKCIGNLKSIGQAIALYAGDNDNFMPFVGDPNGPTWDTKLLPYVENSTAIFHCPSDSWLSADPAKKPRTYAVNGGYNYWDAHGLPFGSFNYSYNVADGSPHKLSNLTPYGSRLILVGERPGDSAINRGYVGDFSFCSMDEHPSTLHHNGQGGMYLFADMGVEYLTSTQFNANYWYLQ